MDTALPGLADEGHADLVRDSLITLLTVMRPDWGSRQAVAERLRFAEQRLELSLPQLCLRTVTAAVTPTRHQTSSSAPPRPMRSATWPVLSAPPRRSLSFAANWPPRRPTQPRHLRRRRQNH